ncbi:MAG TPA: peptide deformylase, partial [Lachnospiraceae bacterium]|nr:peptide deformylase [Lachnospiraceae bacterium]
MAIRNIRTMGDAVLNKTAKTITEMNDRTQELID